MRSEFIYFLLFILVCSCRTNLELDSSTSYIYGIHEDSLDFDPKVEQLIKTYRDSLTSIMDEVLCESEIDMPKVKNQPETLLGNMVSDLCLEIGRLHTEMEIDACMLNIGGLRSGIPEGEVTLRNVFELMPFDNELVIVSLPPREVSAMMDYLAAKGGDPVSGLRLTLKDGQPKDVEIGGSPIDPERTYQIITSDYLANGGDKMYFFTAGRRDTIYPIGLMVRDAIALHFTSIREKGETLNSLLDQRIRYEQ